MSSSLGSVSPQPPRADLVVAPPNADVNSLSEDVRNRIFLNLGREPLDQEVPGRESLSITHSVTVGAHPNNEVSLINALIEQLDIQRFSLQRRQLEAIAAHITSQKVPDVLESERDILAVVKPALGRVLKTLDEETANSLRAHLELPSSLEDIFQLAEDERRAWERLIDDANSNSSELERTRELIKICGDLTKEGDFERAISVAMLFSGDCHEEDALSNICKGLAIAGNIKRAVEVARLLDEETERCSAFSYICITLMQAEKVKEALDVVESIPDELEKDLVLEDIRGFFTKEGKFDLAIKVTQKIVWEVHPSAPLTDICVGLAQAGETEKALAFVESIDDLLTKNSALIGISKTLEEVGQFELAREVAGKILNEKHWQIRLSDIFEAVAKK